MSLNLYIYTCLTIQLSGICSDLGFFWHIQVHLIDSLPKVYPKVEVWVEEVLLEEGNATILTLFICLLTVLYLRERHRRHAVPPPAVDRAAQQPNELAAAAPN